MGAYPNRTTGQAGNRRSGAAETSAEAEPRRDEQDGTGASRQNAHAIEPITMRVPDACRYIGVSRSTLYVLIGEGEIEIVKLGCSTLVLTESLKALVAKRRNLNDGTSVESASA